MARKPSKADLARRQAELQSLTERIHQGVSSLTTGTEWRQYLTFAARFHTYSARNQMLIWLQNPNASFVAGYRRWQDLGRNVRKGERGIRVLSPVKRRQPIAPDGTVIPREKLDTYAKEDIRWEVRMVGVTAASVFDVTQTDGDPIPQPPQPQLLAGQAPAGLWDKLDAIAAQRGFTVTRRDLAAEGSTANGYTRFDTHQIVVRTGIDDAQAVKTLAHEIAHMLLHGPDSEIRELAAAHRGAAEVEAESVAYMVAARHGMDTGEYTFPYVAGWASGNPDAVLDTAAAVQSAAQHILDRTLDDDSVTATAEQAQTQQQRAAAVQQRAEETAARLPAPGTAPALTATRHADIHAAAQQHYTQRLQTSPDADGPRTYLDRRALGGLIAAGVAGHAAASWTDLTDHLRARGFTDGEILSSGLGLRARNGRVVDRFRDRITLPITTPDGAIAGFIGRAPDQRDERTPKYLNSPDSSHYKKREMLYGGDQLTHRPGRTTVAVAEGPFDAAAITAAAHEAGRTDVVAVAAAGTALTAVHAAQIQQAADRIVVTFDPDDAGRAATERALDVLPADRTAVAPTLGNQDPAEIYQRMGAASLLATLDVARPAPEWRVDRVLETSAHLDTIEGRVAAIKALAPVIHSAPDEDRGLLWSRVSETIEVPMQDILTTVRADPTTAAAAPTVETPAGAQAATDHLNPYYADHRHAHQQDLNQQISQSH